MNDLFTCDPAETLYLQGVPHSAPLDQLLPIWRTRTVGMCKQPLSRFLASWCRHLLKRFLPTLSGYHSLGTSFNSPLMMSNAQAQRRRKPSAGAKS